MHSPKVRAIEWPVDAKQVTAVIECVTECVFECCCLCWQCLLAVGVVISIIVYRMATLAALYLQDEEIFYKNAAMVTTATAAVINLLLIFTLNLVSLLLSPLLLNQSVRSPIVISSFYQSQTKRCVSRMFLSNGTRDLSQITAPVSRALRENT